MATVRAHARPRTRNAFRIAIICALKVEADAVLAVLDPESTDWHSFPKAEGDNNTYTIGSINRHNVVVLYSGAGIPKTSAAAIHLFQSFPKISLVLVVGVCGGVPIAPGRRDIFLGDLVISSDAVHYTSKKQYPTGSARITRRDDELGKQQPEARNFVRKFELSAYQKKLQQGIQTELEKNYAINPEAFPLYPGTSLDTLFASDFQHKHRGIGACENGLCSTDDASVCSSALTATCSELKCDSGKGTYLRRREALSKERQAPSVHVGTFGTGDTVMKSGMDRDQIASKDSIDAFEMETAGVWDQRSTIVLKSVCDYADSHKNDDWKGYAAGVAALGLKVLLQYKELPGVESSTELRDAISLRDALAYPRKDAKLELIREDHIPPNSFDWVWSKTPWKSWLRTLGSEESQPFWISGLPGSGKSTLMESLAVDKRTMKFLKKANQSCKILRFFFDFRAGKDTANNRLGLLKMFISELWHIYDTNTPEGGKLEDRHARHPVDEMSEGKLADLLSEMVDAIPQRLLVFIDGLDEYEGEPHGLVDFLQNLRRRTSMHLCLASRSEPVFDTAFRGCPQFAMQNHNEASVRMYIDYAVDAASSRLSNPRTLLNSNIRQLIVSKAQGVMIWARLAVNELLREDRVDTTPNALQKVIDTLPLELESLYEQTLSRLPSEKAPEVTLILLIITNLGRRGRIDDELLYGYFTFLSERCPEISWERQTISGQSEAKGLHLYSMKSRLRTRCGALVNISLQKPELYEEGSWSQNDHGDLVTFKRSLRHPRSRGSESNPRWYATLFHRTFYVYLRNNETMLHYQLPGTLLRQYPDAFQSRVYANVIAAATDDGDWNLENYRPADTAKEIRNSRSPGLTDSLKTLLNNIFNAKLSLWKLRYAIIVDSMHRLPVSMMAQEMYISKPHEAWKEALASPICFLTVFDDLNMFLVLSAEERVLRLAIKWALPRLFCEAYIEVTAAPTLAMLWHELFFFTWNECFNGGDLMWPYDVSDDIMDSTLHKRQLRSYDEIFSRIIPHLITLNCADLPQIIRTVSKTSKREKGDSLYEAEIVYRILYKTRELELFSPQHAYVDSYSLSLRLVESSIDWIGRRNLEEGKAGLGKSRTESSDNTVALSDEHRNLYATDLTHTERLRLGSHLLLLRLLPHNVALLSRTQVFSLAAFEQALSDSTRPPGSGRPSMNRDQRARACLVLLFVLMRLRIDPGYDFRGYIEVSQLYERFTELQSMVSDIILFALHVRGQSGDWPDYARITSRHGWKQEVDKALNDPLVRAIDDDGIMALETLEKYHQCLIDDGIIDPE